MRNETQTIGGMMLAAYDKAQEQIARGALVVVNHSGGKDSQTMLIELRKIVPQDQLLVIHAHLPEVEWRGTWEHILGTTRGLNVRKVIATKTFLEMVERRQKWPGIKERQCTSDLKRGPIEKCVRHWIKDHNLSGLVVNCMGIRAQESKKRAEKKPWKFSERNSKAGRVWCEWLPIFNYKIEQVWDTIRAVGQDPHWAYAKGMSRLSCCFCIMASKSDLRIAAELNPNLFGRICDIEKRIGHTMKMDKKQPIGLALFLGRKETA